MTKIPSVIKSNYTLTPYKFFVEFLEEVASFYQKFPVQDISFRLFEHGDEDIYNTRYRIDPIVIPLLLSLFEQLSRFHKRSLSIQLYNNRATKDALEFLYRCDFFVIAGNNEKPIIAKGRNTLQFDQRYLGAFNDKQIRDDHKVRSYSIQDDGLNLQLVNYNAEEQKRDFLISHYTYKVREHFQELLIDNELTAELHNLYIDILSELITNSVLHSKSTAYALMFVDRYKTKFSISDNGVGFSESMKLKEITPYYRPNILKDHLFEKIKLDNISKPILDNLFTIFDTLFYSSLKDRHGLFDLMLTVVLKSKGYFRIHSENSQIIISNRMMDELNSLSLIRKEIYDLHIQLSIKSINQNKWEKQIINLSSKMLKTFSVFCERSIAKYSNDIKYSSIRFFKVKFRGVHIEVEIPNPLNDDNFSN